MYKGGQGTKWWPWWCYITENNYDNWAIHPEPWLAIQKGTMADFLLDKICELKENFIEIIDKVEYEIKNKSVGTQSSFQNNDQLTDETVVPKKTA